MIIPQGCITCAEQLRCVTICHRICCHVIGQKWSHDIITRLLKWKEANLTFLLKKVASIDQDRKFVINIMHDENPTNYLEWTFLTHGNNKFKFTQNRHLIKPQTFPGLAKYPQNTRGVLTNLNTCRFSIISCNYDNAWIDDIPPIATSQSWCNPSAPIKCLYARDIWHRALSLAAPSSKYFQPCK